MPSSTTHIQMGQINSSQRRRDRWMSNDPKTPWMMLLLLIWMPSWKHNLQIKHPFFFVGIAHGYLGTLFGVDGVLPPMILRTDLVKLQIVGTLSACLITLDVMKVTGYVSLGFDALAGKSSIR